MDSRRSLEEACFNLAWLRTAATDGFIEDLDGLDSLKLALAASAAAMGHVKGAQRHRAGLLWSARRTSSDQAEPLPRSPHKHHEIALDFDIQSLPDLHPAQLLVVRFHPGLIPLSADERTLLVDKADLEYMLRRQGYRASLPAEKPASRSPSRFSSPSPYEEPLPKIKNKQRIMVKLEPPESSDEDQEEDSIMQIQRGPPPPTAMAVNAALTKKPQARHTVRTAKACEEPALARVMTGKYGVYNTYMNRLAQCRDRFPWGQRVAVWAKGGEATPGRLCTTIRNVLVDYEYESFGGYDKSGSAMVLLGLPAAAMQGEVIGLLNGRWGGSRVQSNFYRLVACKDFRR